jgi:hypothetical protein
MEESGQLHDQTILRPGQQPMVTIRYEAQWAPKTSLDMVVKRKISASAGNQTCHLAHSLINTISMILVATKFMPFHLNFPGFVPFLLGVICQLFF